jgi:hypothetical protein
MAPWYDMLEPGLAVSHHPRDESFPPDGPFRAILNVCDPCDPPYTRRLGPAIHFVRRAFADCWPVPFPWLVAAVLELAELRRCGLPTLVHCEGGRSRSPTVIALYWMARDGLDWPTAIDRIRGIRPSVDLDPEGPSRLVKGRMRDRVADCVREYLRGDLSLLSTYRQRADSFALACRQPASSRRPPGGEWDLIEDGLAIGDSLTSWPVLVRLGFDRVLVVGAGRAALAGGGLPAGLQAEAFDIPEGPAIDPAAIDPAVARLDLWRRQGSRVFLTGADIDFFAVVAACVWLMRSRGWDEASAIWYIGTRRGAIGRYLDILLGVDLEDLAGYPGRFGHRPAPLGPNLTQPLVANSRQESLSRSLGRIEPPARG